MNDTQTAVYETLTGEEAPEEVKDLTQTEGASFKLQLKVWNGEREVECEFEVKNANFDITEEQFETVVSNVGQVATMQIVDMLRAYSSPLITLA